MVDVMLRAGLTLVGLAATGFVWFLAICSWLAEPSIWPFSVFFSLLAPGITLLFAALGYDAWFGELRRRS